MLFQDKKEQYLKEIRELEILFHEAQGKEILPLSFFSSSIDILNSLRAGVFEIEAEQLQMMQTHLKENEEEWNEMKEIQMPEIQSNEIKVTEAPVELITKEEKTTPSNSVLADTIGRKIGTDIEKSLSLNDRFMFQRDLFHGNTDEMNRAFARLNTFQSLNEALAFLNGKYNILWDSDSGMAFKELLDKRFA